MFENPMVETKVVAGDGVVHKAQPRAAVPQFYILPGRWRSRLF